MTLRRTCALVALLVTAPAASAAGRFVTDNFAVEAPTKELAKTFGEAAEKFRREKAVEWLGREMPPWPARCPLVVRVTASETGGATTFTFRSDARGVASQEMKIFGDVPRLLNSVLPHEVTHTVFAHHFGRPVPRWADEGGSVLSENDEERYQHDVKCRRYVNDGKAWQLAVLFRMTDYPDNVLTLYAEGYSVSQYLVDKGGRRKFLDFVAAGLKNNGKGWDEAAQMYGFDSVDDLQLDWLKAMKESYPQRGGRTLAANPPGDRAAVAVVASRGTETRTSPAGLPLLDPPVTSARGATPAAEPVAKTARAPLPPPLRLLPPEVPTR